MKLDEIKKLSPHEFAERYPFVQCRTWDSDKNEYHLAYWTGEDYSVKSGHHKAGEPCLEFYNDWHGGCTYTEFTEQGLKIGDDYAHLWDEDIESSKDLPEQVLQEAEALDLFVKEFIEND